MKRIIVSLIIVGMFLVNSTTAFAKSADLSVEAPSAILVEKSTGKVLYEKDADKKMRPASVTKIMTLILIMEAIEKNQFGLDDIVTASAYATSMGGSQVYLKEGEQMRVEEMLKCIVIASANDACVAMAEFVSGSVEEFVSRMNEKAAALGMINTEFKNCTGLESEGHLTTARDISLMSRELLKYNDIKKYTTIWMDTIRNGEFGLTNTNKLIRFYDGATGLKTGYTAQSKYCISATAQKNGMELIAVVMASESSDKRNADAKTMLNYGFSQYSLFTLDSINFEPIYVIKGIEKNVTPMLEQSVNLVVEKGREKDVEYSVEMASDVSAPVLMGQKLGEVILSLDGQQLQKINVVSKTPIEKVSVFSVFLEILNYFLIF